MGNSKLSHDEQLRIFSYYNEKERLFIAYYCNYYDEKKAINWGPKKQEEDEEENYISLTTVENGRKWRRNFHVLFST